MTWVQYCVIEMDDLFYRLCFVRTCMRACTPREPREHIVTQVVFGHQRPGWQRLKWWLRTRGLDGEMWINEAQIELIAMTSHNNGDAKWEYVAGPLESQRLFRFQGDGRSQEGKVASLSWLSWPALWRKQNKAAFLSGLKNLVCPSPEKLYLHLDDSAAHEFTSNAYSYFSKKKTLPVILRRRWLLRLTGGLAADMSVLP